MPDYVPMMVSLTKTYLVFWFNFFKKYFLFSIKYLMSKSYYHIKILSIIFIFKILLENLRKYSLLYLWVLVLCKLGLSSSEFIDPGESAFCSISQNLTEWFLRTTVRDKAPFKDNLLNSPITNSQKCTYYLWVYSILYLFHTHLSPLFYKVSYLNLVTDFQKISIHSQVLYRNIENGNSHLVNEIKWNGAFLKVLAPAQAILHCHL